MTGAVADACRGQGALAPPAALLTTQLLPEQERAVRRRRDGRRAGLARAGTGGGVRWGGGASVGAGGGRHCVGWVVLLANVLLSAEVRFENEREREMKGEIICTVLSSSEGVVGGGKKAQTW